MSPDERGIASSPQFGGGYAARWWYNSTTMAVDTESLAAPHPVRWPKSLYHQMAEMGWFYGRRVQLIEGEIIEMAPMGTPHWIGVNMAYRALLPVFPVDRFTITMQCPIDLDTTSEPEPDIAVIEGLPQNATGLPIPERIRLLVEVSDTSIALDRGTKARKYASAGVVDYWIVCLKDRTVEVHREPVDGEYSVRSVYRAGGSVTPVTAPESEIRVSDLLPPE
ncbi:MAG: Uma2 family endonuclease [Capsulimonadaceae bacterium]